MKKALIGAAVFAGSLGLTTASWSGGGYHSDSTAHRDSIVSQRGESSGSPEFSSESRAGGGTSQGMDSYSKEGSSEFLIDNSHAGVSRGDDLSVAMSSERDEQGWGPLESKDDRDFHS